MKYARRLELFEEVRTEYTGLLASVLWKLTGDRELFAEAMQYALLGIWQNIEKLDSDRAGAYIYRIALSANSKAWRNRIGKDGQISSANASIDKDPTEEPQRDELIRVVRQLIAQLSNKQAVAIAMRYFQQQSYEAIAQKLGCGQAAARSNVSKALAALKSRLSALKKVVD